MLHSVYGLAQASLVFSSREVAVTLFYVVGPQTGIP